MSARPRIASVASVVWFYLGPLWSVLGVLGLQMYFSFARLVEVRGSGSADVPLVFLWFPGVAVVLGVTGFVAALGLYRCREWGRRLARGVYFATVAYFSAFGVSFARSATETHAYYGGSASYEQAKLALMGLAGSVLLSIPFLVIGKKLGSFDVRCQMKTGRQPS